MDLALLSQALHHAAEPERALAEAHRILRPGGRVLVLDLRQHEEAWVRSKLGDRWLGFTDARLKTLLREAGFEHVIVRVGATRSGDPFTVLIAVGRRPARASSRRTDRKGQSMTTTAQLDAPAGASASSILDGAMGTMIQRHKLDGGRLPRRAVRDAPHDLKGNNDVLVLTQPDVIGAIHREYLDAGADIIETNTFNANAISQADYGLESVVYEINVAARAPGARRRRRVHGAASPDQPRFVAGSIGPDQPHAVDLARRQQPGVPRHHVRPDEGRVRRSGAGPRSTAASTCSCVETIFDTLNAKAGARRDRRGVQDAQGVSCR